MSKIDTAPAPSAMTLADWKKKRGYDPETRTYEESDAPDLSGQRLHNVTV